MLFAILQKYEFSSKSQQHQQPLVHWKSCLRYCKSTSFQANHNDKTFSMKLTAVVCDTAKVRVFKQITTSVFLLLQPQWLFAILQKYEFSSKSQLAALRITLPSCCLRYCKSTSFQANHNHLRMCVPPPAVVCDTAKVRVFKQITTSKTCRKSTHTLFAILQKYEFSSKSQPSGIIYLMTNCCLRYCKSTSFQANHNRNSGRFKSEPVVCDTAKVRVFKQITTTSAEWASYISCLRYCKSTSFQANHNRYARANFSACCLRYCKSTSFQANHNSTIGLVDNTPVVCDTAKVRVFKQITTSGSTFVAVDWLFAILQKYEFSSKSQRNSNTSSP